MSKKSIERLRKKGDLAGYVETSALEDPETVARLFKVACKVGLNIKCNTTGCLDCRNDDDMEDARSKSGCFSGLFRISLS